MFVGREQELAVLEDAYRSPKSEIVVLYGRRRIGKSSLISRFTQGKPQVLSFEAIEGEHTRKQIMHFTELLRQQLHDPVLASVTFATWEAVFTYLTERAIKKRRSGRKLVLVLDEIQWMAAGRSKLISLLKYYWDNHWKSKKVMLILCGSIASFMLNKVIRSKALYGRISVELLLKGLWPDEAARLFGDRRSNEEILEYLLIFGGVPKYLEEINLARSFRQNMNRLCFSRGAIMASELEKIFYSQFREARVYLRIATLLEERMYSFEELARKLRMASGGGLKSYLDNLEHAEIIRSVVPFDRGMRSKLKRYRLSDEFLAFYFKYVEPNREIIGESRSCKLFETLTSRSFEAWMGFAFERFCLKHAAYMANIMGFGDEVLRASPYFRKGDTSFQIDLLYRRADRVITLCEVKHQNKEIGTKVIPEVERKCALFPTPKGHTLEKALISLHGPNRALADSEYFHHCVSLKDILKR